ncbi:MAG: L,D-transpeptidase family protein [Bacillota bacterium]
MPENTFTPEAGTRLVIVRSARKLQYYSGTNLLKTYPVAVGKHSTPTPAGSYRVVNKIVNPGGVLGTRWMGLSIPNGSYGIHGTNNPSSIGKYISNGCIRMYNSDVEDLFPKVNIGTPVTITDGDNPGFTPGKPSHTGDGKKHVVKKGETLWKISQAYGVPVDLIARVNNLSNPDILYVGQVLLIP